MWNRSRISPREPQFWTDFFSFSACSIYSVIFFWKCAFLAGSFSALQALSSSAMPSSYSFRLSSFRPLSSYWVEEIYFLKNHTRDTWHLSYLNCFREQLNGCHITCSLIITITFKFQLESALCLHYEYFKAKSILSEMFCLRRSLRKLPPRRCDRLSEFKLKPPLKYHNFPIIIFYDNDDSIFIKNRMNDVGGEEETALKSQLLIISLPSMRLLCARACRRGQSRKWSLEVPIISHLQQLINKLWFRHIYINNSV